MINCCRNVVVIAANEQLFPSSNTLLEPSIVSHRCRTTSRRMSIIDPSTTNFLTIVCLQCLPHLPRDILCKSQGSQPSSHHLKITHIHNFTQLWYPRAASVGPSPGPVPHYHVVVRPDAIISFPLRNGFEAGCRGLLPAWAVVIDGRFVRNLPRIRWHACSLIPGFDGWHVFVGDWNFAHGSGRCRRDERNESEDDWELHVVVIVCWCVALEEAGLG